MAYSALYRDAAGNLNSELDEAAIAEVVRSGTGLLWLHLTSFTEEDADLLERMFDFHPLAIRDCLDTSYQRPKVDDKAA